ncbi:MAG: hypothetical protein ACOY90_08200 [Candidatus Zhuqueibacterota bacterium]
MRNVLKAFVLMGVLSMCYNSLQATDLKNKPSRPTINQNNQLLNALIKTIKEEGYVLLNLHRDNYTLVIPTSSNFSSVLQNLEGEHFLSEDQLEDFSLLWNKTKENGGIGVLEHNKIQKLGQEIARTNPENYNTPRALTMPQPKDQTFLFLEQRAQMLKEIVEYHKAIKQAQLELEELMKEREEIQKRLLVLKKLLATNGGRTLSSK